MGDTAATTETPDNATATEPATAGTNATNTTRGGAKAGAAIPDKRIKAMYASPADAAKEIPDLSELSKLIQASPAVSKLLADKNLVATIFAPNNAVSP